MINRKDSDRKSIDFQIFLFSYVINPGPILVGLAVFGLTLKESFFDIGWTNFDDNYIFLFLGFCLIAVNIIIVINLSKKKKKLANNSD